MKKTLIILMLVLVPLTSFSQQGMFKALFLFNFAKNVEWPGITGQKYFVIAVLGKDEVIPELEKLAKSHNIKNQAIVVKSVSSVSQAGECNMFYVPPAKGSKLTEVVNYFSTKSTLVVSQKPGGCQKGSCINYVIHNGKMKFEISKKNISKQNLKVSSKLLSLGLLVD